VFTKVFALKKGVFASE